ncbi:hypothetical protein C8J56DRAFT_15409 [Mycena floridula]|nr:hypothetical protein C8J56DRAFT_15409 [Mycena floridula]
MKGPNGAPLIAFMYLWLCTAKGRDPLTHLPITYYADVPDLRLGFGHLIQGISMRIGLESPILQNNIGFNLRLINTISRAWTSRGCLSSVQKQSLEQAAEWARCWCRHVANMLISVRCGRRWSRVDSAVARDDAVLGHIRAYMNLKPP